MKKIGSECGVSRSSVLLALVLCSIGALLAVFSFGAIPSSEMTGAVPTRLGNPAFVEKPPGFSSASPAMPSRNALPNGPSPSGPGNAWSVVPSPNNVAVASGQLYDVTCTSASQCWAVGTYQYSGARNQTVIEQWDGTTWSIVSSPNTSTTDNNILYGVTCTSASQCWAVGTSNNGTLIEQWNGSAWSIVASPNTSTTDTDYLNGVTCTSAS
ncbi:MAG: hypothetical protein JO354_08940 [Verrucomicrobia bacterium]|nr:hypothetical protein [Verrucomicrobiota bacterium]